MQRFTDNYTVRNFHTTSDHKLSVLGTLKIFEDIAIMNSEFYNVGYDYYDKHNCAWMLHKWDITFNSLPTSKEKVIVETTPSTLVGFYANRLYSIKSLAGKEYITAKSLWFFVDTIKRKPIKIHDAIKNAYEFRDDGNVKIDKMDNFTNVVNPEFELEYQVRKSDIDWNGHLNNAHYIQWSLDTLPDEITNAHTLKNVKVMYKKEVAEGETVKLVTEKMPVENNNNVMFNHTVLVADQMHAGIVSIWEKK